MDTGCCLEDLLEAMNERERASERERERDLLEAMNERERERERERESQRDWMMMMIL